MACPLALADAFLLSFMKSVDTMMYLNGQKRAVYRLMTGTRVNLTCIACDVPGEKKTGPYSGCSASLNHLE